MLHRNEVVPHPVGLLLGSVERLIQGLGNIDLVGLPSAAADLGQCAHRAGDSRNKAVHGNAHAPHQLTDKAILLLEQGQQQMGLSNLLIAVFHRHTLGGLDGLQRFLCKLIEIHKHDLLKSPDTVSNSSDMPVPPLRRPAGDRPDCGKRPAAPVP